jgi:bifunctional UDP-N-acetylglucosamine pyrophosphorylase/glucosamine-1-phosphate N-acetyltransferase
LARRPPRRLAAVVMAAGKGKRLKSSVPKVLHPVCGRPILWHVLRALAAARPDPVVVVLAHEGKAVEDEVRSWGLRLPIRFVDQGEPLGTGHAVLAAERAVARAEDVLVVPGDSPLLTGSMLRDLLRLHRRVRPAATVQTTELPDAKGYGRVIREGDRLRGIVEEREATPKQRRIHEVATSVYVFRREDLFRALPAVDRNNRQREYYLPDVLGILADKGEELRALPADFGGALDGNSRASLARVAEVMRRRINESHMAEGVTLVDPSSTYIDVEVRIGRDAVVFPNTYLEGRTRVGTGARIGPSARLVDSIVGDEAEVQFSVVKESRIGPRAAVGPFANVRPGTVLAEGAKAGTFVEIKNSRVGRGSKVPHLSYVGDATIGERANVGAGTVTVNYDGYEKHRTVIGDDARIGSDTMLVAPVKVGRRGWTGAGSTITRDVPEGGLAVERSEQKVVEGYADRRERKARTKGKGRH